MPVRLTLLQRALGAALLAAVTPYALFRVLNRGGLRLDLPIGLDADDVYGQLFEGEVSAELGT